MKAIMIVNLPDKINVDKMCKTPVSLTFEHKSYKTILYADGYLKPLPQKKEITDAMIWNSKYESRAGYYGGYNDCIDEILGEEE